MTGQSHSFVPLSYDVQSDRLIGGDFLRDFQGKPTLSCLASLRRAKLIYETALNFQEAYQTLTPGPTSSVTPFGTPLAVIELPTYPVDRGDQTVDIPVDELFNFPQLASAPLEYRQLCQLITLLPGDAPVEGSPITGQMAINQFISQLWRTLSCAHQNASLALTRSQGTCIKPSNLTPQGEILDIYFLTRASEARQDLAEFQRLDLAYAFFGLWQMIEHDSDLLVEAYRQAMVTYHGPGSRQEGILALADQTASQLCNLSLDNAHAETIIQKLAVELHRGDAL